jgi:hypothetical protein
MAGFRHAILNEMALSGRLRVGPAEPLPIEDILKKIKHGGKAPDCEFQRLFFCFRWPSPSDQIALKFLQEAAVEGSLTIESEFISTPPDVLTLYPPVGAGRTVESAEHHGMKSWVVAFLKSKGIQAYEEISHLGYEVDVGSLKDKIFVECGDTEPHKVFSILFNGYTLGVLQYDAESIVWFYPKPGFSDRFAQDALDFFGLPHSPKENGVER